MVWGLPRGDGGSHSDIVDEDGDNDLATVSKYCLLTAL